MTARFLLRLAAFLVGLGIAIPAFAQVPAIPCPSGLPPGTNCNAFEGYTYMAPGGAAIAPYSTGLRIFATNSPVVGTGKYIDASSFLDTSSNQTAANKTFTNPTLNGATLAGIIAGNFTFSGVPSYSGLSPGACTLGLALDAGGRMITVPCGGGGGSGFPITIGSTSIAAGSTTTTIASLTLLNPMLSGTVAGSPTFNGVPSYSGLSSAACSFGLGLNGSGQMIETVCPGSGGSGITQLNTDVIAGPGSGNVAATVAGLQNRPLASTAPTSGQCLGWNGSTWLPVVCGSGGGTVGIGTGPAIAQYNAGTTTTVGPESVSANLSNPQGGPLDISNTTVTPGSYTNLTATIDPKGRITAASNGTGVSGFTGGITVASACTGASCTPVTSCLTYSTGLLSTIVGGSCSGTNYLLIQTGSAMLIQTGSHLLIQ